MKYVTYLENGQIDTVGEAPDSYIPMLQMVHPRFLRYSPLDSELYNPAPPDVVAVDTANFNQTNYDVQADVMPPEQEEEE